MVISLISLFCRLLFDERPRSLMAQAQALAWR
jgi:hypothetical protein